MDIIFSQMDGTHALLGIDKNQNLGFCMIFCYLFYMFLICSGEKKN